jgi:signal transduction histidine kinase
MTSDADGRGDGRAVEQAYVRTEFLERVAHELRGPSGVTLGALEEIEHALGDRAGELALLFAIARRGVRRVLHTAERLQRTASLERHEVAWAPAPVDLRTTLQQAVRDAELLESRRGVTVVVSLPDAPCTAWVDGAWMSLALAELVMNAIAHAKKVVSVGAALGANGVVISITDDGAGFVGTPPARFEPPRELRGLGLSLPIARDVVLALGGELVLDAPKPADSGAQGAQVRIVIPFGGPPAAVTTRVDAIAQTAMRAEGDVAATASSHAAAMAATSEKRS